LHELARPRSEKADNFSQYMVEKEQASSTNGNRRKPPSKWSGLFLWLFKEKTSQRSKLEQAEALLNEAGFYLRRTPQGLMILPREITFKRDWYSPKDGE